MTLRHKILPVATAFWFIQVAAQVSHLTAFTKDDFCSGRHNVRVSPKHIPDLLAYIKYCGQTLNIDRAMLANLYTSATLIIHKAFLDGKIGVEELVAFLKLKQEAEECVGYDEKVTNQWVSSDNIIPYDSESDDEIYNIDGDISVCKSIINKEANNSIKTIIKLSQLPLVSEFDGIIDFPPFNLSRSFESPDTPYLILDTYILAMRCASLTPMTTEQVSEMSNKLIFWLKTKVMPLIPVLNFEKAYKNMMSMVLNMHGKVKKISDSQDSSIDDGRDAINMGDFLDQTPSFAENVPIYLKFRYDFNLITTKEVTTAELLTLPENDPKAQKEEEPFTDVYSTRNHFIRAQLLDEKVTSDQPSLVIVQEQGRQSELCNRGCDPGDTALKTSYIAVACVAGVLGACCCLALILYWLLCCWNGCKSGSQSSSEQDPDECNELELCLDDYARNHSQDSACRCHCSLTDTNQLDVIASLHSRCEQLSKKISQVVRELSQETVFEKQAPFDKLRNFVRQVSLEMVNEEEMLQKLIKLQESKMKLHSMK